MKKLSIMLLLSFCTTFIFAQSVNESCITCDSNMVDFTKGASAIGSKNISSGINSLAAGYLNEAVGDYSVAMPFLAKALGDRSFALGYNSFANGMGSLAIGTSSQTGINGTLSIAIGTRVSTNANWAMVLGMGSGDSLLTNRSQSSFMVGFNSDRPTFFVSPASGIGTSGKIGIGDVTNPSAKLHIRADETEDAIIKLETTGANQIAQLILADDENTITLTSGGNMVFHTNETGNFKFNNGKVGIGTNAPETKLDVDGTLKTTGFKLVDGSQAYGRILQSDDQGNATWVDAAGGGCVQCSGGEASGEFASIVGENNFAEGHGSFAGGKNSEAIGNQSFAFGNSVQAKSLYSIAIGKDVTTWGGSSVAIGNDLQTTTTSAMVIGKGFDYDENRLKNDIPFSLMIGFNSSKPTFFVSESVFGMNSTGRIGIGNVTSPEAKLHIRADENYDTASVYIQTYSDTKDAYLWMGNKNFGLKKHNSSLEFLSTENFVFNEGSLGIGTDDPQAKVHVKEGDIFIEDINHGIVMKSPDGNCWRGTLNNQGQMQFTQVNCDDLAVSTPENKPSQNSGVRIFPNPTINIVTVEISAEHTGALLSIKSSDGKELASSMLSNTRNNINLGSYPAGVYFFYISNDGNLLEVKKVVKE